MDYQDIDSSEEFTLLLDDLTSIDNSSKGETLNLVYPVVKEGSHKKHVSRKRKIDVVDDYGKLVCFEASYPRPRVVRSDIRRSYANMYVNAMNSGDFTVLFGLFDTFCCPTFSHSITRQFTLNSELKSCSFFRRGVVACAQFWCYIFVTIPDSTLFLQDVNVFTNDVENTSRVIASYVFKATKIYEFNQFWKDIVDEEIKVQEKYSDARSTGTELIRDIVKSVEDKVSCLPLRTQPLAITSRGQFIIHLDEHKRMVRMEMCSKSVDQ